MRILVVVHGFPPTAEGGAEYYAAAHASALSRRGDDVLVLTREADPQRSDHTLRTDTWRGLPVVRLNNTFRGVRSFRDSYDDERITAAVAPVIDRFAPDVAHLHHLTCLSTGIVTLLKARGVPTFYTLHDYWLLCHRGQLLDVNLEACAGPGLRGCGRCVDGVSAVAASPATHLYRHVERLLPAGVSRVARTAAARLARRWPPQAAQSVEADRVAHMRALMADITRFLAPSRHMRNRFVDAGVDPARITLAEYGFEGQSQQPAPDGSLHPNKPLRIGFLGSLMVSKGPHVLLDACARLPAGSVTVDLHGALTDYHGDNRFTTALAARLHAPGIRAHGRIPHDAVPDMLQTIDVLAVPSIWAENSPLVIREAFLACVPVVASRVGGIPEAVEEGLGGLLFEGGNVTDLARVLTRLLEEPDVLPHLRRTIPPVRSIDADVEFTRGLYQDALNARSVARQACPPPPGRQRRRLAAIVLNYRAWEDTHLAVRSLLLSSRLVDDIIVVDNDEGDNAHRILGPLATHVTWIANDRNLGYPGGMNVGIRAALKRGADLLLLVNSDVVVPVDTIARLERALDGDAGAGIAGPAVLARHTPDVVATMGMSYHHTTGRMRHLGGGRSYVDVARDAVMEVDGVSGCFMLIDRTVIDRVGLLDEDYFFGFEDLDLSLRALRAGFRTVVVPDATVLHEGGRSMGALSPDRLRFAARNHLRLASRTSNGKGRVASGARGVGVVALNVAHAFRARGNTLPVRLRAVGRGVVDYLSGRVGPLS